jgi:hypothetical protein
VAGRYSLRRLLGRGGGGEVWEAQDAASGDRVAVKLLTPEASTCAARVRREVGALRLLRLPGVVRLLDEGMDDDRAFLVMELVTGDPFPGAARGPCSWPAIAGPTLRLLEVLARVHAAGVVHRDLKPANVLVGPDAQVTVLDFGISTGDALAGRITRDDAILGTPDYLSPEQVSGHPVGPRTDLYAVGIMLFEALTGCLPFEGATTRDVMLARLGRWPAPVRSLAPEVPEGVARVVDRLLSRNADDRPRSAGDVVAALGGASAPAIAGDALPWLGGTAAIDALVAAARAGRAVDLRGAPGVGRTRCLDEVRLRLLAEGRPVWVAPPSRRPFGSLSGLVEGLDDHRELSLEAVRALASQQTRNALRAGTVVIVDAWERLDRWSCGILEASRGEGCILRAVSGTSDGTGDVVLAPLVPDDMKALFVGPERIFHLRSDAAHALWLRTQGLPRRVAEEVQSWVGAGLARWDGGHLALDRTAIERLRAGWTSFGGARASTGHLDAYLADALALVSLAWPNAHPGTLCAASGQPAWLFEAALAELEELGFVRRIADGRFEPRAVADATEDRLRRLHQSVARVLLPGTDGRLTHLLAAGELEDAVAEAAIVARRRFDDGRSGEAFAALRDGIDAARRLPGAAWEESILSAWARLALADRSPRALETIQYEMARTRVRTPAVIHAEQLVRAVAATLATGGKRPARLAEAVPPFSDLELELHRQANRIGAARRQSLAAEAERVSSIEPWAREHPSARVRAAFSGWLGWLRYHEGRFEEAAELHARAAAGAPGCAARIQCVLDAASALMEAFRFEEAEHRVLDALAAASHDRQALLEGRAEWMLRAVRYRRGDPGRPDVELVETIGLLALPNLEAIACLTEAAYAWRAADLPVGAELAGRAAAIWTTLRKPEPASLARALAGACGAPTSCEEARGLLDTAAESRVFGCGVQTAALLAIADPSVATRARDIVDRLAPGVPRPRWSGRLDVLSVVEAQALTRCNRLSPP